MAMTIDGTNGVTFPNASVQLIAGALTSGTAVASTSGTSIDFTGIPSWAKRVTMMFNGVSTNGTSVPIIQIGSGSPLTTGYLSSAGVVQNGGGIACNPFTTGFGITDVNAAVYTRSGILTLTNLSGNIWVCSFAMTETNTPSRAVYGGGGATLSGVLDRVRLTTVNGTDLFDAGTVNIMYEG